MGTVILLRHGQSTANVAGVLAGRAPGIGLSDKGQTQAQDLITRLADISLAELVVSPMLRCEETVAPLIKARSLTHIVEPQLSEVDYGRWTGQKLHDLMNEPLWRVVQTHPSAVVFPEGEGLAAVQTRAVAAVRHHDARITQMHGPQAVWLLCSHGDVIKAILADALGQHLDSFQRIVVDPTSISAVRYTENRPFVLRVNDHGGTLDDLSSSSPLARTPSEALPGGTTGE